MRLQYIFADSAGKPLPFHVKSNWRPPPQQSMALKSYLERTKFEIAFITFSNEKDNLSAQQREALKTLSANKEINLKKADKGTTTVIMDTGQKTQEDLEQVSNENFYKPLETPTASSTAAKVANIVKTLFDNGHIDNMTYKWLSSGQNPPRILEFYTPTKIHKNTPVGRPIVSGSSGPTERTSSFVDSLLQPIAQKQESYIKDTTHFINFIENTPLPEGGVLATLDVCSFYTNIPQEQGIEVVCQYYVPRALSVKNSDPSSPSFLWHTLKNSYWPSAHINLSSGRDLSMAFSQCGPYPKIVFLDTEVFKAQSSLPTKSWMFKHILSRRKRSNTHTSPHVTLSALRRAL